MKHYKTLVAAVLMAASWGASAADVQLYGIVDLGLGYTNTDTGVGESTSKFNMRSGQNTGSRVGLRGLETIDDDLKVGFVLESGINMDDGSLDNNGRLFGRESNMFVETSFGTLSFGRVGELISGLGTYGLFGGAVSAFGTGWSDIPGHKYVLGGNFGRMDNAVTYKSPNFAGVNFYGQYSYEGDSLAEKGVEGKSSVDRYYALGATYKTDTLYVVGVVDSYNYASWNTATNTGIDVDDSFRASLGVTYQFPSWKILAATQYFKDVKVAVGAINTTDSGLSTTTPLDGFGLNVSTIINAFSGRVKGSVGFMDAERSDDSSVDIKRYAASIGFEYPLSKRTMAYLGAGTYWDKYGASDSHDAHVWSASSGIVHSF